MKLKTFIVALAALTAVPALAQSQRDREWQGDYKPYPYNFVSLQGGAQTTFTNYDNTKLFMPMGAVSVGRMFTPVIGARLDVSGWRNKGAFRETDQSYYYNAVTYDADLLVNLSNLIWKQRYHCTNLYFIGGLGLNYAWHNGDVNALAATGAVKAPYAWKNRLFHNFRAGVQVEQSLGKNLAVNLEVTANHLGDRFNSKVGAKGDWQVNALVGLSFKFGHKKRCCGNHGSCCKQTTEAMEIVPATPIEPEEVVEYVDSVVEEIVEEIPADTVVVVEEPVIVEEVPAVVEEVPAPKEEPAPVLEDVRQEIFFAKGSSVVSASEMPKVERLAKWMKDHPSAYVTLDGYADAQTGTAAINERLSKQRTAAVQKLLVNKYGISANRLTRTTSHGDRVQPFTNNDSNRVVITYAKETE
ncbi:MAG: OmpA family protein [Alloprevotella sp.]|nr:OmpA family protein [Alloprevotella sp.]